MNANHFMTALQDDLSPLVHAECMVYVAFSRGLSHGPGKGSISVNFINLPEKRVKEQRGGGAEVENNHMKFRVSGFGRDPVESVDKVRVEQSVNGVYHPGSPSRENRAPNLRAKAASPESIASYLAGYINGVAEVFAPNFTHN